jgi:hypothetical protein
MIIDSHCHAGKGDGADRTMGDRRRAAGQYLQRAARGGITKRSSSPRFIPITRSPIERLRASSQVVRIDSLALLSSMLFMTEDACENWFVKQSRNSALSE